MITPGKELERSFNALLAAKTKLASQLHKYIQAENIKNMGSSKDWKGEYIKLDKFDVGSLR